MLPLAAFMHTGCWPSPVIHYGCNYNCYAAMLQIVDALRPNYHNASEYLPLVFPIDDVDECKVRDTFANLVQQ